MKRYLREREDNERASRLTGIVLTVAVYAVAGVLCSFSGLKYLDPPPPETSFLIDFSEMEEQVHIDPPRRGTQPKAEEVDRTKPIELVQKSESPYQTLAQNNVTTASQPDDFGDVETPVPEPEVELDKRASFPGMSKKDTTATAPISSDDPRNEFKAGAANGNTERGKTEGSVNAHVKGRNTVGTIPRPAGGTNISGVVVMSIKVDQYGNVQQATVAEGTTISDKNILTAARNAALNTHFNMSSDAPALQEGTITYNYNLK